MKRKILIVLLVFLLLLGMLGIGKIGTKAAGKYDFYPVNSGLPSINHSALAISPVDPKIMYVGTKIGIYVSEDGGETWWQRVIDPEATEATMVKSIVPSLTEAKTAYIGTNGRGVYITKDAGFSWNAINTGLTSKDIETIAIDPKNPNIIYVGTYGAGIFKSTNGGQTFTQKNKGLPTQRIKKVVVDYQDLNVLYAVLYDSMGIFRSEDGGNNWVETNTGITGSDRDIFSFAIDPVNSNVIYAGTYAYGKILKSENSGETWKQVNNKFTESFVSDISIDYKNANIVYVATGEGIFKSEDGGLNFKKRNSGLSDTYTTNVIVHPKDTNILFVSTYSSGLYKSSDAGGTWVAKSLGLPYYSVASMQFNPKNSELLLATAKGIYLSKDRQVFTLVGLEDIFTTSVAFDPKDANYVYAGSYYKGFYRSDDSGATWKRITNALDNVYIVDIEVDPSDYRIIYVATEPEGIYKSTDMGATFKQINIGLKNKRVYAVEIDSANSQVLYAATFGGGVFKSTNGGSSWNEINKGLSNYDLTDIEINPKDSKILYVSAYRGGVFKSTDSGANWVEFNKGLENKNVLDIALNPGYPNALALATEGGVFFVENYGTTWEKMNEGLTDTVAQSVSFNPNNVSYLYAGTFQGGLFRKQVARTITATATEGGKVSPSGATEVPFSGEVSFTITPDTGYKVKELYLGSKRYDPYTTFKVTQITLNTTFQAVFEKTAPEKPEKTVIILQIGNKNFTVNGQSNELDSPPIIKNGRTLLPIRAIIESLGGTIGWDATEKKVTITLGSTNIELWIGKSTARVNGVEKPIDSANPSVIPEIINGRTMLPVRFVTENLGASVGWDGATKTVTISYPAE